jgi:hypothetical protein
MNSLEISNKIILKRNLSKLDKIEFDQLFNTVYAEYELRNQREINNAANKLYLGARVRCTTSRDPRLSGVILIVDKINSKNVKCHIEGRENGKWNITATLLELA